MKRRRLTVCIVLLAVALLVAFGGIVAYGLFQARKELRSTSTVAEITKISYAFHNYLSRRGSFPPRVLIDPNTQAVTFWPILLEREIGSHVGDRYKFHEKWNSKSNLSAVHLAPFIVCTERSFISGETIPLATFVAVADLSTILQDEHAIKGNSVLDGRENTLLVAEIAAPKDPWAEPKSLTFDDFVQYCHTTGLPSIDGRLVGFTGQLLLFADFEIYQVSRPLPKTIFRAIWTKDGGEDITRSALVELGYIDQP